MRKPIIAGNWKMNKTPSEAKALVTELIPLVKDANCDVVVGVPAVNFAAVAEVIKGTNIKLGAQNMHWKESGAYTGELSAAMLKECGVEYVILGHSERRQYFGETDETVNKRTTAAIKAGLTCMMCVGETLDEREADLVNEVIGRQLKVGLKGLTAQDAAKLVIAYEPVWAIGTGKTATPEQAQQVHAFIRETLGKIFGTETAETIRIQYGGSMKPGNAAELLAQKDIDGGLIGGAALKAADFAGIISAAANAK